MRQGDSILAGIIVACAFAVFFFIANLEIKRIWRQKVAAEEKIERLENSALELKQDIKTRDGVIKSLRELTLEK